MFLYDLKFFIQKFCQNLQRGYRGYFPDTDHHSNPRVIKELPFLSHFHLFRKRGAILSPLILCLFFLWGLPFFVSFLIFPVIWIEISKIKLFWIATRRTNQPKLPNLKGLLKIWISNKFHEITCSKGLFKLLKMTWCAY